jgi:MSHA biogenesis protein MshI
MSFAFWKKKQAAGWRIGISPGNRETALAIVCRRDNANPLLKHCGIHPSAEVKPEHILSALISGSQFAHAPVSGVVNNDDYQLVQVEAPEVPEAEMRSAIRWKLRDVVSFPVEETTVDIFDIPASPRRTTSNMKFAVAARNDAVKKITELLLHRAKGFDVIDIPELCLRNLSVLLPQDEKGVALLALGDDFAQLVITRKGILFVSRHIELLKRDDIDLDATTNDIDAAALALEIQRSVDYYESHFDQPAIQDLVIAPSEPRTRQLANVLRRETSLTIEVFEVERYFEVAQDIEIDTRWPGLIALGAALRGTGTGR